ncbi:patatin-like phospholipase family protein [Microbulbifer epialgicus]|uniref:Patatin-like phospholipase family protein n=1 Tax=Microbulbifer epialgicus TaxID=393907 RepID=A0ABV4P6B1_9GAMM
MLKNSLLIVLAILIIYTGSAYVYNNYFTQSITFDKKSIGLKQIKDTTNIRKKDTINILIIDGGGVRGLIPLYVLKYIESRLDIPITEAFDIYSGVSTGAIIASGINIPKEFIPSRYKNNLSTTEYLIELYKEESDYLFSSPWYHKVLTGAGLFSPSYLGDRLHQILEKHYTKSLSFTELKNYVIIPTLDIHSGEVHLFKNRGNAVYQLPTNSLYQLITAAVSAETAFPPVAFRSAGQINQHSYFADAALAMNNPTSIVLLDVVRQFPDKNYYILILGAGSPPLTSTNVEYSELKNWGRMRWIRDALSTLQIHMDHQQIYALELAKLLSREGRITYHYLNVEVINPFVDVFEYDSIKHLKKHANRLIESNEEKIQEIIQSLTPQKTPAAHLPTEQLLIVQ